MRMLSALLGVLFVGGGFVRADEAKPQRKVALLVGINEYDKRGFKKLEWAERDVEELAKVLRHAGFEVRLLTGSTRTARATRENIDKAIDDMLNPAKKELALTQKDMVLIALAGHGQQFEVEED